MNSLYPIITSITLAMFTNICFSEDDSLTLDSNIKVITPTKLSQSLHDTPSSVTIISKSDMTKLGIKTVPEALRLVPGMAVTQASGNDYRISYHGTNGVAPRRMQVLIDGVSIYRFGIAQIDWAQIPILTDQIERIEVTRSPAGTTYGANSFFAVVNIITKHPADSQNFSTEITAGSLNTKITSLYFGGSIAETDYRIAASIEKSDGYDKNFRENDREDASDINRYNWKSSSKLNNKTEFNTSFSYVNSYLENEFSDAFQITSPNIRAEDYYASTGLTYDFSDNNEFKIELSYLSSKHTQKWTTCPPTFFWLPELRSLQIANPELAQTLVAGQTPSGIPAEDQQLVSNLLTRLTSLGASATQSLCGNLNQNYKDEKLTIEAHDTYLITNNLRAVSGLSFTRSEFKSETFVGGRKKRNRGFFMTNIEYKPNDKLVLNIGGILEHEEKLKDNLYPSTLLAVNYHMTSEQTIRFSNSTAIRTPDLLENDRNWNYLGRNLERSVNGSNEQFIYVQKTSAVDLEPEETISTEIAYHANFINYGLSIDIKWFHEKLDNLISEKLLFFDLTDLSNNGEVTLKGVELEAAYKINDNIYTKFGYGYLDSKTNNFFEKMLYARHKGFVSGVYSFSKNMTTSLTYYGSSTISTSSYNRIDWVTRKNFLYDKSELSIEFKISNYGSGEDHKFIVSPTFSVDNKYDNSTHYFISIKYLL